MLNHRCEQVQYTHYRSKNSYWLENPILVKPPTKEIGNVPLHVTTVTLTRDVPVEILGTLKPKIFSRFVA